MKELNKYKQRLYHEWKQYGKIIIAVDYDDTLFPWKYKSSEDLVELDKLVQLLRIAHETGAYITIFTCSAPDRHEEIQKYCEKIKLPIDSINVNPVELPYGKHGKVYANIFLDDRAGLNEAINQLEEVMYMIRGEQATKLTLGENG